MLHKIGFEEALQLILDNVPDLPNDSVSLVDMCGRVLTSDLHALVDSPSVTASLKDGFAVHSESIENASPENRIKLKLIRTQVAGELPGEPLEKGSAIKVTTGAPLPPGADAVLSSEYAEEVDSEIYCMRDAGPGRNVLYRGVDVHQGQLLAGRGEVLHPALIGLIAAAGIERVEVKRLPTVAVIGTGDEVVAPGAPLPEGKLYASNMVETVAWLRAFGIKDIRTRIAPDSKEGIAEVIKSLLDEVDLFITSGGSWGSERDLVPNLLNEWGWQGFFHRVRLGPGKAAGFGLLKGRSFFILPGGPPSHEAAFLLLALPGIMAMMGRKGPVFPIVKARLTETMEGQSSWTQVVHAIASCEGGEWNAQPLKGASRLSSMAQKNALILLSEGVERVEEGSLFDVMLLGH